MTNNPQVSQASQIGNDKNDAFRSKIVENLLKEKAKIDMMIAEYKDRPEKPPKNSQNQDTDPSPIRASFSEI